MPFRKSKTLLHISSLLTSEHLDKFIDSEPGNTIPFPFDLQTFCTENDLKLEKMKVVLTRINNDVKSHGNITICKDSEFHKILERVLL